MENKLHTNPNAFLTFIFAFFPGVPHLYMGLTKKGLTILGSFAASFVTTLSTGYIINNGLVAVVFVVPMVMLYCYSFFDAFIVRRTILAGNHPDDTCALTRFYESIFLQGEDGTKFSFTPKFLRLFGIVLLVIGGFGIIDKLMSYLNWAWPDSFVSFYSITSALISASLIIFGIILIRRGMKGRNNKS